MVDVPDEIELTAPQTRVLGSLIEKAATTPDVYPLTLKALTTACNQTSNRDPVVQYDAQLVETTLLALKGKGLARVVHPGAGERATKYRHVAGEALGLDAAELALLGVLLLRGAQTSAELLTRTERMHRFASLSEVESTLESLASRERPIVRRIDRQAGRKADRWIQLLEANAEQRADAPVSTAPGGSGGSRGGRVDELEHRVEALEARLAQLVDALGDLVELPEVELEPDRGGVGGDAPS